MKIKINKILLLMALIFSTSPFAHALEGFPEMCTQTANSNIRYECISEKKHTIIKKYKKTNTGAEFLSLKAKVLTEKNLMLWRELFNPKIKIAKQIYDAKEIKIEEHFFTRDEENQLLAIVKYKYTELADKTLVHYATSRDLLNPQNGKLVEKLVVRSKFDSEKQKYIDTGFELYDENSEILASSSYDQMKSCREYKMHKGTGVLMLEPFSIDINHENFKNKLFVNKQEALDGLDNDNNGFIDDCIGLSMEKNKTNNFHGIFPKIVINRKSDVSSYHANMVADAILSENANILLYPISGSIRTKAYYETANKIIKTYDFRFVNMSLAFKASSRRDVSHEDNFIDAITAVKKLVAANKQTLFFASAGNGDYFLGGNISVHIDRGNWHYPASIKDDNIFTVGAINSNEIIPEKLSEYRMSTFSNVSFEHVDILAPGENFLLALPGGHKSKLTEGTSFAAPYTLKVAVKMSQINPQLTAKQIKEILLKTAYIPNLEKALEINIYRPFYLDYKSPRGPKRRAYFKANPDLLPVRSGGIIYPERALATAKLLKEENALSTEEAVLEIRKQQKFIQKNESNSDDYFQNLQKLWLDRKI